MSNLRTSPVTCIKPYFLKLCRMFVSTCKCRMSILKKWPCRPGDFRGEGLCQWGDGVIRADTVNQ